MFSSIYIASPHIITSKLWNLTGDPQVSILSFMPLFSPYQNCSETRFGNASEQRAQVGWQHHLGGVTECCATAGKKRSLQTPSPPCPWPPHPADKAALAKSALQNIVFCSEKFKIKPLKLHHQKGRILTRLPSQNESDSRWLLTSETDTENLVGYKMRPKSPFRFVFLPKVRSALVITL